MRYSLEWDFDFRVAPRRGLVYGQGNAVEVESHDPPGRVSKYDNRDLAAGQILLIPNSFVGCEQEFEAVRLG